MKIPPVIVAGSATKAVDKQTWRSGSSRVLHRAVMAPVTITTDEVDQIGHMKAGFAIVADGELRFFQQQAKWNRFRLSATNGEITIRFHRNTPSNRHLELGTLNRGHCIELAFMHHHVLRSPR